MALVLCELPSSFTRMKTDYYNACAKRGFEDYSSPWLPVMPAGSDLIRKGDLCMNEKGTEVAFGGKRQLQQVENGKVKTTVDIQIGNIRFIWIGDAGRRSEFLAHSPFREYYSGYNRSLRCLLTSKTMQVFKATELPIWHGTDRESAANIQMNGFNYYDVTGRDCRRFGFAFCATTDPASAMLRGNKKGVAIRLAPARPKTPPLIFNRGVVASPAFDLDFFLDEHYIKLRDLHLPIYTWEIVCRELFFSGICAGQESDVVHIYEPYHDFRVAEVVEEG